MHHLGEPSTEPLPRGASDRDGDPIKSWPDQWAVLYQRLQIRRPGLGRNGQAQTPWAESAQGGWIRKVLPHPRVLSWRCNHGWSGRELLWSCILVLALSKYYGTTVIYRGASLSFSPSNLRVWERF